MRKRIVLLLSIVMVLMLSTVAFAAEQDTVVTEEPIDEYTSVIRIDASLSRSGSTATSNIVVTEKIDLDSIKGTLKLVNSSGTTVATKNVTFTHHGTTFYNTTSFNLSKKGTYKVKFTLKTYKNGTLKETIAGSTNTVKK